MQDKVDLAAHSLSARYGDNLNELISLGIAALTLLIVLAPLIRPRNHETNMSGTISLLVQSSSIGYGDGLSATQRITLQILALTLLLSLATCSLSVQSSNSLNTAKRIAFYITGFILPFYLPPPLRPRHYKTNISRELSPLVHISTGYSNSYTTTQRITFNLLGAIALLLGQAGCSSSAEPSNNLNPSQRIAFVITQFVLSSYVLPLIRPRNYNNTSSTLSPLVHGSSVGYGNIYTIGTAQWITLKTVSALTLLAACSSNFNTARRITFGVWWFFLSFCLLRLIKPHNYKYKANISSEISRVVHSISTWYGNRFNTAPRVALGIAALTLLLVLEAHCFGVEYSNSLNTATLMAVKIAGCLLSFYLPPLIMPRNYKANISSEISPVVHSSRVEHGNNKTSLLSVIRYYRLSPFHFSGLASRFPRPRMIVRA